MQMPHSLYKEHILDHYKNPRNFGLLKSFDKEFSDSNPICGDEVKVQVKLNGNKISLIGFTGKGCAISQASTSMLTEIVVGKTIEDVKKMTNDDILKLIAVPVTASRVKCALLGFVALKKALYGVEQCGC